MCCHIYCWKGFLLALVSQSVCCAVTAPSIDRRAFKMKLSWVLLNVHNLFVVVLSRGDYLRCCKFCYPLCAFVILAACVVACVGLVWMQVALKEDLDAIKEKFRTSKYKWNSTVSCLLGAVWRALIACLLKVVKVPSKQTTRSPLSQKLLEAGWI